MRFEIPVEDRQADPVVQTMPDGLHGPGCHYRHGLMDMDRVDCRYSLEKDTPDSLILAILCNFGDHDPQAVVNHIHAGLGEDPKRFREYAEMLHVLSANRNLKA
uniref:Uncharacterized protein n=1 Tax=Candidatus Kentrum eta TaxID=2126337 RepID=A0A450VBD1_9GAMM|nr:MAG: hypothetical protein BECKH772B_GA0070898_102594 [Candidatus Kentron sp. H]VFK02111.1 MAG: hypothetical protein BECKH772A_GA0070896_102543 [Candidatus Kentron sp. H]VFK05253.1 MAG: hypothetical protein BECKH772C_GA0070978_102523 [Candidatus Kentron sp. H]